MLAVEVPSSKATRVGAVARARGAHALEEGVLVQAQPGQPVVAAVPAAERGGQGDIFHAVDAADPAGQRRTADVVRAQPAAGVPSASSCAARPLPMAEVAVYAVTARVSSEWGIA